MKSKILISALLISAIAIFTSCEKEDANLPNEQGCSNILCFENIDQFNDEVQRVSSLSLEEKEIWAEKEGFNSFGVASETFYETINPDDFKDIEEVKQFVAKNSKYVTLSLENGEYVVETKFSDNPFRFFMNEDHMFQIGEKCYKIFDKGMVSASIQHQEKLRKSDGANIEQLKNDSDLRFVSTKEPALKSTSSGCSGGGEDYSSPINTGSKTYRTYIHIYPTSWDDVEGSIAVSFYKAGCQVRTLGIWWAHRTTLYTSVNTQLVYSDRIHGIRVVNVTDDYTSASLESSVERFSGFISSILTGYDSDPHFQSYYGTCYSDAGTGGGSPWGDISGLAKVSCN